jgi:NAD(P)H-hydrate epimerase
VLASGLWEETMRPELPEIPAAWPPDYPLHEAVSGNVSRDLDRRAQEEHGVPSIVLMEHASRAVASLAATMALGHGRVVVLCGPGNNGGDGYGAARALAAWGVPTRVLRCASRLPPGEGDAGREAAWAALEGPLEDAWSDPDLVSRALADAEVVVDALFGVGLARDLEGPYPGWIRAVNAAPALRLAVDVPSGLDADTGALRPVAVRADVTATMAMPKTGLVAEGAGAEHAGRVVEVDIGLPGPVHRPYLRGHP